VYDYEAKAPEVGKKVNGHLEDLTRIARMKIKLLNYVDVAS